ncbi:MAG: hypothetical protein B7Y80_13595 [Hyphomicrobium sp. 32-62-53]|nr:MAG: hypothetical protein B7Y80_13595 [Hyphomicrobium sp. 32-62-53]
MAVPPSPPPAPDMDADSGETTQRRAARRRPAGPPRGQVAANDDVPSIGGLIYALDQKPDGKPFRYAMYASIGWGLLTAVFGWMIFSAKVAEGQGFGAILSDPSTFLLFAALVVPVAVMWFLALLAWRAEELRLRSSTMTEVAIRLAEPDRMAEQSIASLGQAVRRQVSFMNDAVSRALGRAGELEALVHNEVAALERSYEENERKIRGLIQELSGERGALLGTSERVTDTLRSLGTEIPQLIDRLSNQQIKLATIIQNAGENLTSLESAVGASADRLETTLGQRTEEMNAVLSGYTSALGDALNTRTEEMHSVLVGYTAALADSLTTRTETIQNAFQEYLSNLNSSLDGRTQNLQAVFEEYARALDNSLANRAQILDTQLIERTRALDNAFSERLMLFDQSIQRSTQAIDYAVSERSEALTSALENHARVFSDTIQRQTHDLDEQLVAGISAVRRSSENITKQSLKAIEGLAGQSEMLRNVSENLLGQINSVTNRFENQGQTIMRAANALESVNFKIDNTLQTRHAALSQTLDNLSGKAEEFGRFVQGYSSTIEGSLSEAELKARSTAEEIRLQAEATRRNALADLERLKLETDAESGRRLDELRNRFATVSSSVTRDLDSLSSRVDQTADEVRQRAARTAAEIASEQARLKDQLDQLPLATRDNADQMRRALSDQLKALDTLANLTQRTMQARDVSRPVGSPPPPMASLPPPTAPYMAPAPAQSPAPQPAPQQPALSQLSRPAAGENGREGWSLGDLLARASRDEEQGGGAPRSAPPPPSPPPQMQRQAPFRLDIDVVSRALDQATTSALWSRITAGHRNVLSRGLYSAEGRQAFDDITRALPNDPNLQATLSRYLEDFERVRRDLDQRDPSGRSSQIHLMSDSGRVYLFLAHATGRLS